MSAPQQPPFLVATALWTISSALIVALDELLGEPIDSYVNGSQVWLSPDGPDGVTIEYRLHPIGGYIKPKGMPTDQVFSQVALSLATPEETTETPEATETTPFDFLTLWEGLEAFVAFDDEGPLTPEQLKSIGETVLGIPATAFGMVDHEGIADRWQASDRHTSIVSELRTQLGA
jgi:hypothetical protein